MRIYPWGKRLAGLLPRFRKPQAYATCDRKLEAYATVRGPLPRA
jgi:hypothetical protein